MATQNEASPEPQTPDPDEQELDAQIQAMWIEALNMAANLVAPLDQEWNKLLSIRTIALRLYGEILNLPSDEEISFTFERSRAIQFGQLAGTHLRLGGMSHD